MSDNAYWLANPLEPAHVAVLARIRDGRQRYGRDLFEVAYLVAIECVTADDAARTLALTDKGREGLAVFETEKVRQK